MFAIFIVWIVFIRLEQKANSNFTKQYVEIKIFVVFNQYQKSDKIPYFIYADVESLIKRIDRYQNNFEISSTAKVDENIPCRYSMFSMSTIWTYDGIISIIYTEVKIEWKRFVSP